jgi:hypothetical protein
MAELLDWFKTGAVSCIRTRLTVRGLNERGSQALSGQDSLLSASAISFTTRTALGRSPIR